MRHSRLQVSKPCLFILWQRLTVVGDPVSQHIHGRLANRDVGSEQSFNTARKWLNDCVNNHEECRVSDTTPILPTRVLDLAQPNGSKNPFLWITEGQSAAYACLSYCWGSGPQPVMLTAETIKGFMTEIPVAKLPQTIIDAIFTARKLGLRYLWIDSLCILQDSPEDKDVEVSRMSQIYNIAHVTISAANGKDCGSGFLAKRTQWWRETDGPPIRLPYRCPEGIIGSIYLTPHYRPLLLEPLHSRVWTLQEHVLSRRVLMYGMEQLVWICCHGIRKDGGVSKGHSISLLNPLRQQLLVDMSVRRKIGPGSTSSDSTRTAWSNLVEQYSCRKQTVPADRVNALSAALSIFQRHMQTKYIAGFWRQWLIPDLLWKRVGEICERPAIQLPSWSWLSVNSEVTLGTDDSDKRLKWTQLATVVGYNTEPTKRGNPFGQLSGAYLAIRGHCVSADLDWDQLRLFHDDPPVKAIRSFYPCTNLVTLDSLDASYDLPRAALPGTVEAQAAPSNGIVWCRAIRAVAFPKGLGDIPSGRVIQGILLKKTSADDFRRIVCFDSYVGREDRLLIGPKHEIRIV